MLTRTSSFDHCTMKLCFQLGVEESPAQPPGGLQSPCLAVKQAFAARGYSHAAGSSTKWQSAPLSQSRRFKTSSTLFQTYPDAFSSTRTYIFTASRSSILSSALSLTNHGFKRLLQRQSRLPELWSPSKPELWPSTEPKLWCPPIPELRSASKSELWSSAIPELRSPSKPELWSPSKPELRPSSKRELWSVSGPRLRPLSTKAWQQQQEDIAGRLGRTRGRRLADA